MGRRTHRLLFCPLVLRSNEMWWCGANSAARRQRRDGVAEAASGKQVSVAVTTASQRCQERSQGHQARLELA